MNRKGYTLIELMITIAIIGFVGSFVVPALFQFMSEEKIAQKAGSLVREFQQEATPEIITETETVIVDRSGVTCQDGKKVITIDGTVYHLGIIKNTWGDLEGVDCQ